MEPVAVFEAGTDPAAEQAEEGQQAGGGSQCPLGQSKEQGAVELADGGAEGDQRGEEPEEAVVQLRSPPTRTSWTRSWTRS